MSVADLKNSSGLGEDKIDEESIQRALIIDDDEVYAQLISRFIKQNDGAIEVDVSCNPLDGIAMCTANSYDILLIDHNLPDMTGTQFLHRLQSVLGGLLPPAIVLTADGGTTAAVQALRANAYDFLSKEVVTKQSLARSMENAFGKYQLKKSIVERTTELELANAKLEERNREIQDIYQTISHEVKTPLAAAREFLSIVRDGIVGPIVDEQAEILDYALTSCDQIATHFNDLVEMTRLDAGKMALTKRKTLVDSLLVRSIASCSRAIEAENISVSKSVVGGEFGIYVDDNRITQVLSNLIGNAVKYSPNGEVVEVSVERVRADIVKFTVTDRGCGIEDKDVEKIFNRLYQVSEECHEFTGAGLGLGLSIAKEIVNLHDGKIGVESEVGVGSRFYFELPAVLLPDQEAG